MTPVWWERERERGMCCRSLVMVEGYAVVELMLLVSDCLFVFYSSFWFLVSQAGWLESQSQHHPPVWLLAWWSREGDVPQSIDQDFSSKTHLEPITPSHRRSTSFKKISIHFNLNSTTSHWLFNSTHSFILYHCSSVLISLFISSISTNSSLSLPSHRYRSWQIYSLRPTLGNHSYHSYDQSFIFLIPLSLSPSTSDSQQASLRQTSRRTPAWHHRQGGLGQVSRFQLDDPLALRPSKSILMLPSNSLLPPSLSFATASSMPLHTILRNDTFWTSSILPVMLILLPKSYDLLLLLKLPSY